MFLNSCPVLMWAELPLLAWHFDLLWESSSSLLRNSSITYKVTHLICWAHAHYSHTHLALRSSLRGGRVLHHGLWKITFSSCKGIHHHGKIRKNISKATKRLVRFFLWICQILTYGWSLHYNPIDFNAARQGNRLLSLARAEAPNYHKQ